MSVLMGNRGAWCVCEEKLAKRGCMDVAKLPVASHIFMYIGATWGILLRIDPAWGEILKIPRF